MNDNKDFAAHFELLQKQKELLKQAKSRQGQKATQAMRRSRAQLEQEYFTGALSAHMSGLMNQHTMKTTFIGEAYPPCLEPMSSLEPVLLRDLKLETHHRGRILVVKTFCDPIRLSSIQNAIEDVRGDVDRISIYNLPSTTSLARVLPKGAIVAVKEPYYKATADGGVMVRVDHPSDIVLLEPHDTLMPPQWRKEQKPIMSAFQLKEKGNAAFKNRDWQAAGEIFSEALTKTINDADADPDLRLTLHRNRAQVRLNLGQYELAATDALASVIAGYGLSHQAITQNVKSYFRAGQAHYRLGDFSLAKDYLDRASRLHPMDETVAMHLEACKIRISEQKSGKYDFTAMAQSATSSHKKLDHADFTNKTKVASAGKCGRGLFATKNIKCGIVIMVEKAFQVVFEDKDSKESSMLINTNTDQVDIGTQAERLFGLVDKMRHNPKQASRYLDLFDGGNFKSKEFKNADGDVVLDVFQVQAIAQYNGFGCPSIKSGLHDEGDQENMARCSTGIWIHASYMNHSCLANASRAFFGDMMIVRATRDIKAGEEILMSYYPAQTSFTKRKERLSSWGFRCGCPLCRVESQVPASPVSAIKLATAKDLSKRLQATHDNSLYHSLPRLACVSVDMWLVKAGLSAVQAGLSSMLDIANTTRVLQDLGYKVNVKGSGASIDRTNGVVCSDVIHAALYNGQVWDLVGRPDIANVFVALAKEMYVTINGEMEWYEDQFG
ncbi:hypothetical protein Daus18300_012601 [Diaporthe australafricana]|uniref:SET domain-containing protein n=1 Tax=Diaporthe australafricana TaxID=127596 RepID=A0ABR3W275_9PEZI